MKRLVSFKSSILTKALIPGLIGLGMLTINRITTQNMLLQSEKLQAEILENNLHFNSEPRSNWLFTLISGIARSLGKTIFESYENYWTFMLMMLFVNVFLHGSDILRQLFSKENKIPHWKSSICDKEYLKKGLRSLVRYSLIFCFYQVIWIAFASCTPSPTLHEATRNLFQSAESLKLEMTLPSRILQQEEISMPAKINADIKKKPSLSIGKVLSQVDVYAVSIKQSKDEKTIFVTTNFPPALKILDISEPEYPVILSTLNLPKRSSDYIFKSILASPDETKLYISNIEYLQVIDITSLKSPSLMAFVHDPDCLKISPRYKIDGFARPNLLISKDEKFLFVSGYGLQTFDISVPTSPSLIRSVSSRISSGVLVPASIALSDDKKTLYYTDGGLWICSVEDPKNIRVLSSFNTTYPITSMILSNDAKTAFVLSQNRQSNILLQKLDISDIYSIKAGKIVKFDQSSTCQPIFLERTPDNLFMIIIFMDASKNSWSQVLIFDTQGDHLLNNKRSFVNNPFSVMFTEDYKRALVGNSVGKLEIVEMYLDFPNKHAFAESKNVIQTFDAKCDFFTLSSQNENWIYSMTDDSLESISYFRIHEVSSSNLNKIVSYEVPETILQMVISQDEKRAFWVIKDKIMIMDISDPKNIIKLGGYTMKEGVISFLVVSRDGKTGYLTFLQAGENYFEIIDFSDLQNFTIKSTVKLGMMCDFAMPVLSYDERTVFIMLNRLMIYNVSDPLHPTHLSTLSFLEEEYYLTGATVLGILSHDDKTLFVRDESSLNDDKIHIINVSDLSSPQVLSTFRFPVTRPDPIYSEKFILVSADSKTIYIARPYSIMVVDVSNLSFPKHLGSIRVLDESILDYVRDFSISNDGRIAFVLTKMGKMHVVSIDPLYSTFLKQDILMLGERYSSDLQVIKMNEYMDYERIEVDCRFVKFALAEHRSIQNLDFEKTGMKVAPTWMNFDLKTQTLGIEARRKSDLGSYQVYFGFSTQIEVGAFSGVNETMKSEDIVASLLALGYIDSQRFLTENFGEVADFILPTEYSGVKEKIYLILKRYSFGTFNEIRIIESLNVTQENEKFRVNTASLANLKVEISLFNGEAQFLSRHYGSLIPTIQSSKSRLIIEASLKDINLALQEIVINLPKNTMACDGDLIIDDKLNPVRTESMKNISRYFNHNQPPELNKNFSLTIQNQVDKELVWTGQYFQIKLNPYTFFDKYTEAENLNYQLVFIKENNEATALPTWLSFSDLTLMGTAPEEILNRDFDFELVVKNEFQDFSVPLKVHVKISSSYVLKLLMRYSPYVLSIVGLLISANKIFNIVFKSTYKHRKDFHVRTDEEITSEVIFPVSFIREEIKEARKILKFLEKRRNRSDFLSTFMVNGERRISRVKVLDMIKSGFNGLGIQEKKTFSLYFEGHGTGGLYPKELINEIVINNLTNRLIKSNEERETRRYFEEIKGDWPVLVEWDLTNSCFRIIDEKFNISGQRGSIVRNADDFAYLKKSLIDKSNINVDLLKDAILAYAFDCQNIDIHPLSAQLQVKERKKTSFWKTFLKFDLKDSTFCEKGKIGYGIGYTKEYNTLSFNGVVKPDIMKKTIVVQIRDRKQKILKELWIFGNAENKEEFDEKSEIEAKGKDYEIF